MLKVTEVVNGGYCVGCGACAVKSKHIHMAADPMECFKADLAGAAEDDLSHADMLCPFSDGTPNEDDLAASLFGTGVPHYAPGIGYFEKLWAGHITDEALRLGSSSGGLTSWLLKELINTGKVDGVIHVGQVSDPGEKYRIGYVVSENTDDLYTRRKSQYYATHFDDAIKSVYGNGKSYAFVGVPCFVKAARHLAMQDEILRGQLRYFVGLVCGHLKSGQFAELMAWQVGIRPDNLGYFDFRHKVSADKSNDYEFLATSKEDGKVNSKRSRQLYGSDWGHAFFQLKSCDYCDDIFAETADICFGDAWINKYEADWRGNNIVISRRADLSQIIESGGEAGNIKLDELTSSEIVASQNGNFRHRWDGLSVRLELAKRRGISVPWKRIAAGSRKVSFFRRHLVILRQRMAEKSHGAFLSAKKQDRLNLFIETMMPLTRRVARTYFFMRIYNYSHVKSALLKRLKRVFKI